MGYCNAVSLVCRSCGVHNQCCMSLHGMLECMLRREIVFLLNVAGILFAGRLVSEQNLNELTAHYT